MFQKKATPQLKDRDRQANHRARRLHEYRCRLSSRMANEFRIECATRHFLRSRDEGHCRQRRHWDPSCKTGSNPRFSECPYRTKPPSKVWHISFPILFHSNHDEHTLLPTVFSEKSAMSYKSQNKENSLQSSRQSHEPLATLHHIPNLWKYAEKRISLPTR